MIQQRVSKGRRLTSWVNTDTFPPGQTMVFVHGAGGDHTIWKRQYRALCPAIPIAAVDLPGHGGSAGPGEEEVGLYADWLHEILVQWGICRPILIGHSLGAAVCLTLASSGRHTAAAVVAVGGGVRMPVSPTFLEVLKEDPDAALALAARLCVARSNQEGLMDRLLFPCTDPKVLAMDFLACDRLDLGGTLGRLQMPTLVVCGEEDKMTPPSLSVVLREAIPGARLSLIAGAGHGVMIESAEAFNEALTAFTRSLSLPEGDDPMDP